jgi:cephalosporin-C deacetylase
MPLFDLPLSQLRAYVPEREEPEDFDLFWQRTLAEQAHGLDIQSGDLPLYGGAIRVADLEFAGFGGHRIKAWHLWPGEAHRRGEAVVRFPGYGAGRGLPHQWLSFAAVGFDVFVMDVRGQGAGSDYTGATPDPYPGSSSEVPGYLTRGISNPDEYYLRRLYVDAVRFIDVARARIDGRGPGHVTIAAGSQGGGVGLAVAGLRNDIDVALLDVPSFALFRRVTEISGVGSRAEIATFLAGRRGEVESVFRTLSYFDTVNFAARAHATAVFSVGLMDQVCPPSSVFAAYNHYAGPKDIRVWPYNGHEHGGSIQAEEHLSFLVARSDGRRRR